MADNDNERLVEMNPGEYFMMADNTILVDHYESILADVCKIGSDKHELAYLFTFIGKINHKQEHGSVTVAIPLRDAFNLVSNVLDGLEMLKKAAERDEEN